MTPIILVLFAMTSACQPDLSGAQPSPSESTGEGARIELWPPMSDGLAAPVVRAYVILPSGLPIDAQGAAWVEGDVGDAHLRQLAARDPSSAFSDRFLPHVAWLEPDREGGAALVLSPTVPLQAGTPYAVANGDPPLTLEVSTSENAPWPLLRRVWPPEDMPSMTTAAVWCGDAALPVAEAAGSFDPGKLTGTFRTFATPEHQGAHCLRFDGDDPIARPSAEGVVPPPMVQLGEATLQLDPTLFIGGSLDEVSSSPLPCEPEEVTFGPGCARVEDDRLRARAPNRPMLWAVSGEGLDEVFATAPLEPFTVRHLPPSSRIELRIGTLDRGSTRTSHAFSATTRAPMSHVVLNEVLANANGPEPLQEWVEILNDGLATAELESLTLIDIGGETPLPHALLAPGAYALLVNEGFVADGEYDPPPAPGALVLEVAKLGKNGLANAGEPLKLVDERGSVLSRFPDEPKPKAGLSVARTRPDAPDGLVSSFVRADPPTPGAPNELSSVR